MNDQHFFCHGLISVRPRTLAARHAKASQNLCKRWLHIHNDIDTVTPNHQDRGCQQQLEIRWGFPDLGFSLSIAGVK